jgi:hypothetical protein
MFIIQGVEGLYDEELADQLGIHVEAIAMMRVAMWTGLLVAPWLFVNVTNWLHEKRALLSEVSNALGN